jgi:hypothetical protein
MFNFGSPEDTALLRWGMHVSDDGPGVPDGHWEEMDKEGLDNVFIYLYMAVREGLREGIEQDVIDIFLAQYDEVFEALASVDEEFREAVREGRHQIVLGYGAEHRDKYLKLAGLRPSES